MEENKKIDKQIVIMVILVIILILSLLGILVYEVYLNKNIKDNVSSNTTLSTSTTTTSSVVNKELEASNVIFEYLEGIKNENKIGEYNIISTKILTKEDMCPDVVYDENKIYYSVEIEYEKIDETFELTGNDDNSNTDDENKYKAIATYVISNNKIEDFYTEC